MAPGAAHGAGEAQPVDDDGRRACHEDVEARILAVAVQVDEDVDAVVADLLDRCGIREVGDVEPMIERGLDAGLHAVIGADARVVAEHLDLLAVMQPEDLRGEEAHGVLAQIG